MNIKDVVKVIQASESAQIATFGKDETEGFPEIRALLNLANPACIRKCPCARSPTR